MSRTGTITRSALALALTAGALLAAGPPAFADSTFGSCVAVTEPGSANRFTDCSSMDVSARNLSGLDLRGANFGGASLNGSSFAGADLSPLYDFPDVGSTQASAFSGAVINGTSFPSANLQAVELRSTDLIKANFAGANLAAADLSGDTADQGTSFAGANMSGIAMDSFQAAGSNFSHANLSQGVLTNTGLAGVNLTYADLSGADLSDSTITGNLSHAKLVTANLSRAMLAGTELTGADLTGAQLDRANLARTLVTGAVFTGSSVVPGNISLIGTGPTVVTYTIPATTGVSTFCSPASGSVFTPGVTPVTCSVSSLANASAGTGTFNVTLHANLTGTLKLSAATQMYGTTAPATASVTISQPAAGMVTLVVDGKIAAWVRASVTGPTVIPLPATLVPGLHAISTIFAPDSHYYSAPDITGATLAVHANLTGTLGLSAASQMYGTTAPAKASIAVSKPMAGTVSLWIDGKAAARVAANATGPTIIALPATLLPGVHAITAVFTPTSPYYSAPALARALLTGRTASTTTLAASAASQTFGATKPIVFTATVAQTSKTAPAGHVVFRDGTAVRATVAVSAGTAHYTLPAGAGIGVHRVTATFVSTTPAYFLGSASAVRAVTVVKK